MIERGPATEAEMILAFVRAEVDSSRYGEYYRSLLNINGQSRDLMDQPNLSSDVENVARKGLLRSIRGYGANWTLFTGFPSDIEWRRVLLEPTDFETLRYARHETWVILSGGTRLVSVGARNLSGRADTQQVGEILAAMRNGACFAELIAVEAVDGSLILVEGHSRATAYVQAGSIDGVEAIVGTSPSMAMWEFY
jgi:hypothetical protein